MAMVWYEIKKILVRPSCQIAMILLVILAVQFCTQVVSGDIGNSLYWIDEDGQRKTGIVASQELRKAQKKWTGTLDQEMLEDALEELKRIEGESKAVSDDISSQQNYAYIRGQELKSIRDLLNQSFKSDYQWKYEDYFIAETLEPEQLPLFYENRINQLKEWLYNEQSSGFQRYTEKEKQYLISCYESLETPFEVGYTAGWDMAYEASASIGLWGSIILAYLMSGIFAGEFRWKADSVYFSTECGRKEGVSAKLKAGFVVTTALYWITTIAVNLFILGCLGFEGSNCPLQATFNWWNSIYNVTFLQRSVLSAIDGYVCWLFISALVMLVSAISKSITLSVTIPSLLILIPRFLDNGNLPDVVSNFLKLMPYKMMSTYGSDSINLFTFFGSVQTPITIQRILYPCITVLLVLSCYRVYRKKELR